MGGSYSYHYSAPSEKLTRDVEKVEEKAKEIIKEVVKVVTETKVIAVPFTIHRCSKLTADNEGYKIWANICAFVNMVTNKVVQHKEKVYDENGKLVPYEISATIFCVPEGDVEAIIHDMCHWLVSNEAEKGKPNCGMNDLKEHQLILKEELAWTLETWIFSAIIGEPDLVDLTSPHTEIETFHYWVRVNDPIEMTKRAMMYLESHENVDGSRFDVTVLRRLLASWIQWKEKNPSKDAQPRGCLGWGQIGLPLPITNEITSPVMQNDEIEKPMTNERAREIKGYVSSKMIN